MEIRVLGPVEVVANDGAVVTLGGRQRRLLAALVVRDGGVCSPDWLIDAIWGASTPRSAAKVLQVYISRLRKALPDGIRIRSLDSGYAADFDRQALDAVTFERLVNEATASVGEGNPELAVALLDSAVSLWRGDAYGEYAFEDFARAEAERLEELRLFAVEVSLDAGLALGRHARLLPQLRGLAAAHPLRERLCGQLMLALYRCDRQTEALDAFRVMRVQLREQFGLEPGGQLRTLQRRILEHDAELAVAVSADEPAHGVPEPRNRLLGRERELGELRELLQRDEVRLLVLTGAGGSGKTRLALATAAHSAGLFADGAALVELAPLSDPDLVLSTIANTLGVPERTGPPLESLVAWLRRRELLLVLDNAEHLRPAATLYPELLARAPRLTLLVTSRIVLHLSGEHVYPVRPLTQSAAVELFRERAREADPSFEPDASQERAIERICARLDGLPLAIELAASRTRALSPVELLGRLESRLPLLTGGARDLPARQQTLRATLDWSYSLLQPDEQRDLAGLAIFAGGWTLEAAEAVCGSTLDRLGTLLDHSLVQRGTTARGSRFTMLETIREYALGRLDHRRRESLMRRLCEYLIALADSEATPSSQPALGTASELLAAEFDNMRAAVSWALSMPEPELALRLAIEHRWFGFDRTGTFSERSRWLDDALRASGEVPTGTRARALETAARIASIRGDFGQAASYARESVRLYRELSDDAASLEPLYLLGYAAAASGDIAGAKMFHEECLELATRLSIPRQAYRALHGLGEIEREVGNLDRATQLLEQSAAFARETGEAPLLMSILHGLGDVALDGADPPRASRFYRESLQVARDAGIWPSPNSVYCVGGLAAVAGAGGDIERAGLLWGGVDAIERQWGTPFNDPERGRYEHLISACAAAAPFAFAAAAERGSRMAAHEVIDAALDEDAEPEGSAPYSDGMTIQRIT